MNIARKIAHQAEEVKGGAEKTPAGEASASAIRGGDSGAKLPADHRQDAHAEIAEAPSSLPGHV